MVNRDQDGNVKKSLSERLEGFVDKIPGLRGYMNRQDARHQDKLLRTYSAEQIGAVKQAVDRIKEDLLSQGSLGLLDDLDRLCKKLDRARDTHRFDSYGYTGAFDPNKIMEDELAALYEYDQKILDTVSSTRQTIESVSAGLSEQEVKQALPVLRSAVEDLLNLVLERKNALSKIGG